MVEELGGANVAVYAQVEDEVGSDDEAGRHSRRKAKKERAPKPGRGMEHDFENNNEDFGEDRPERRYHPAPESDWVDPTNLAQQDLDADITFEDLSDEFKRV